MSPSAGPIDMQMPPEPPDDGDAPDPYAPDGALAALAGFCERAGLPLPPLPQAFIPLLQQVGEGVFSSRNDLETLSDLDALVAEAAAGEGVPFVALSHEGYGVNSWQLRYCVSLPAASVFAAVPFGGLYRDAEADSEIVGALFGQAEALVGRALAYRGSRQFVVDYQGPGRGRWCEVGGAWQDDNDALSTVASALEG